MFVCQAILLSSWIASSTSDNHLSLKIFFFTNCPYHSGLHIPFSPYSLKQLFPYYILASNSLTQYSNFSLTACWRSSNSLLPSTPYLNLSSPSFFFIARAYHASHQKTGQCTWPIGFPSLKTHHTRLWSNLISTISLCSRYHHFHCLLPMLLWKQNTDSVFPRAFSCMCPLLFTVYLPLRPV